MRKGSKFTDAQREKLSRAGKGRVFSEEHKRKLKEKALARNFKISDELKKKQLEGKRKKFKNMPEEIRKNYSESARRRWKDPIYRNKMVTLMKNGGSAYSSSFIKNPSKPQVELYNIVKNLYDTAILNFPILEVNRNIDIAIPDLMIAIEYDGSYWHQDHAYDMKRQNQLELLGWKFIRYVDIIPNIDKLKSDIKRCI